MARSKRGAKKATKKRATKKAAHPRAPQALLAGSQRVYWSPRSGSGKKKNPGGVFERESGDYGILLAEDAAGWHWWVSDETGLTMAAASLKPEKGEDAAMRAAKRAIGKYEERKYPARVAKPAKPGKSGSRKRARLPSILTRI